MCVLLRCRARASQPNSGWQFKTQNCANLVVLQSERIIRVIPQRRWFSAANIPAGSTPLNGRTALKLFRPGAVTKFGHIWRKGHTTVLQNNSPDVAVSLWAFLTLSITLILTVILILTLGFLIRQCCCDVGTLIQQHSRTHLTMLKLTRVFSAQSCCAADKRPEPSAEV